MKRSNFLNRLVIITWIITLLPILAVLFLHNTYVETSPYGGVIDYNSPFGRLLAGAATTLPRFAISNEKWTLVLVISLAANVMTIISSTIQTIFLFRAAAPTRTAQSPAE